MVHHWLDPIWQRVPFPYAPKLTVKSVAGIDQITMARTYWGRALMQVHCYRVGDTLIDTGLACLSGPLLDYATRTGVRQAWITHHHEDHAGNAAALRRAGIDVRASQQTALLLSYDHPIPFYEHLVWGRSQPAWVSQLDSNTTELSIGNRRGIPIPARGHCPDQVAFYVPEEGWLFSGDAFLHEQVRLFRRDEDFWDTVATLDRFLTLDFDTVWCGHRPRITRGKQAISQKREWLLQLADQTIEHHRRGLPYPEIADRLNLGSKGFSWLSAGDASGTNLVRSIVTGPVLRPEHVGCGVIELNSPVNEKNHTRI